MTVVTRHELGGRIWPVAYRLPDRSIVKVDCITDERQAACLKSGGQGMRYTGKVTVDEAQADVYLFYTGSGSGSGVYTCILAVLWDKFLKPDIG